MSSLSTDAALADSVERLIGASHACLAPGRTVAFTVDKPSAPQSLIVVQEVRRNMTTDTAEVARAIEQRLATRTSVTDCVLLVAAGSLPLADDGSVARETCRESYVAGRLQVVAELQLGSKRVQETLARIWSEILDVNVGAEERFIDFTDSMAAMEYVNRVRDTFQVDIPATALFEKISTIAKLAELIGTATTADVAAPIVVAQGDVAPTREAAAPTTHDHAIALPGGTWTVWRSIVVRGAGFSAALPCALAGRHTPAAAAEFLALDQAVIAACRSAATDLGQAIRHAADPTTRASLRRRRRHIQHRVVSGDDARPQERAVAAALERRARARAGLESAYAADWAAALSELKAMLRADRFREAIVWQNRTALPPVIRKLEDEQCPIGDRRNAAGFVAMVAQRYATKNDSIGFFGPVGWGSLTDEPHVVDVRPGPGLLADRRVYFEGWAIDAFARALNADPDLRPWSVPRLKAGVWAAEDAVYAPLIGRVSLRMDDRRVLAWIDGRRTAAAVARCVLAEPDPIVESEAAVFAVLERLVDSKLIAWQFEVAPQLYPEQELASRISAIEEPSIRHRCEAAAGALSDARGRVAAAAGDAAALERALADLDAVFTQVTGTAPTRRAGEMYAGRGIIFEDCRRDCAVTFGHGFLSRLGPALSIVLDGARWVSTELRAAFGRHLRACHALLRARVGSDAVDAHMFVHYVGLGAREALEPLSADVRGRFQDKWRAILDAPADTRRVTRTVAEVRDRAADAFAASGPSSWGRYFTPDIMVAAAGPDAFARGDFQCVLGEVHSNNTVLWSCLTNQHPDVAALDAALTRDTAGETVVVVQVPKARWLSRVHQRPAPGFWRYEYGDDLPLRADVRSMPAALLLAVDDGQRVLMTARDGRVTFDAFELFAVTMSYEVDRIVSDAFSGAAHAPRITVGGLTVSREQWRTTAGAMAFLRERDRGVAFARVRAWARALGMPRRVFYKSAGETKPCYLDFDSPLFVEGFLKLMRRLRPGASVRIVEMMPDLDETWLVDAGGARYTSELRIAARAARTGHDA